MRRYWNKEVRFRCDFYHYSPESAAFDLGLERAGMRCVGQVEIEPFCQKVLAKHWPDVWRWNDVKTLTGAQVAQHCGTVDLLCGGVPCQPASVAGKRKGTADDRWIWPDFLRLVSEVKPVWVLAENPRGVLSLPVEGMQFSEWIAREFGTLGYELLPVELAAEDVGAPHQRERIFFVGYSAQLFGDGGGNNRRCDSERGKQVSESGNANCAAVADASNAGLQECGQPGFNGAAQPEQRTAVAGGGYQWPARPGQPQHGWEELRVIESALGCAVAGLSERLARRHRVASLKALGNAIVPQVAEVIGRAIMEASQNELR
ncbi:MAG TPA: DNA cytosine methyltransferase [Blastocatellia bacterium]|nr:DNA cytosine methyltransferase [Blastocatellia bacterium]